MHVFNHIQYVYVDFKVTQHLQGVVSPILMCAHKTTHFKCFESFLPLARVFAKAWCHHCYSA